MTPFGVVRRTSALGFRPCFVSGSDGEWTITTAGDDRRAEGVHDHRVLLRRLGGGRASLCGRQVTSGGGRYVWISGTSMSFPHAAGHCRLDPRCAREHAAGRRRSVAPILGDPDVVPGRLAGR
jgi:hypothetical protein